MRERLAAIDEHCRACGSEIGAGRFDVLLANTCTWFHSTPIARHVRLPSVLYLQEPFRRLYEATAGQAWSAPPDGTSLRRIARHAVATYAHSIQVRDEIANAATFDRILVNSSFSRESLLRAYGLESRVSWLGIDLERFRPTGEPRERFVVALGGFDRGKGGDRAVRALATIPAAERPRLVWIANFSREGFEGEVRRLAKDSGVELDLRVRIPDAEVVSLLSRAALMLYTSRLEPFGLAPLEANACGTPVVAIAEGGVRETIQDGVNGFVAPDDDPVVLGRLVSQLTSSPARADELGRRALAHVRERWGVSRSIDEIERHLREVVAAGASREP
jgi:glycosyltransferase involved in cell wall biosynthesis